MIKEVKAIDDTTVQFTLTRPMSTFVEKLGVCGIVPKHAYDDNFKDNLIGSGPYKFVQWDKGQQVIAQVNEDYLNAVSSGVLCSENRRVIKSALLHPNRESHAFCSCNEWRFDNILVSS